jgi:hypothetical protein
VAQLPIIQFNNFRDPQGYFLSESNRRVVRNGSRNDNFIVSEPLKNKVLCYEFANTVATAESVLKFVLTHGPLTVQGNDQGDPVDELIWHAARMRDVLKQMSARRRRLGPAKPIGLPLIPFFATINWDRATNNPRWALRPSVLIDGLWLQVGQAVTRGARIRECAHCDEWFEVGQGTGRRLDATFCSDEHRVHCNSLKRSRGK